MEDKESGVGVDISAVCCGGDNGEVQEVFVMSGAGAAGAGGVEGQGDGGEAAGGGVVKLVGEEVKSAGFAEAPNGDVVGFGLDEFGLFELSIGQTI